MLFAVDPEPVCVSQLSEAGNILTNTRTLMGGINTAKEQTVSVQKRIKVCGFAVAQCTLSLNRR